MIECQALTKKFRTYKKDPGFWGSVRSFWQREFTTVDAVHEFSFTVQPGELIGLLGPNGAGKTTLMKMLSGLIAPSQGMARVLGYEPFARTREFRRRIALVMGQKSQLWWDIPALDSFYLLKAYYEVPDATFRERLALLTELLQVQHVLRTVVRKLSLGERMKMELIASLLHGPEVLFLDEPTIGLDVVAQRAVREFLLTYHRQQRTTIVLTSHYMADVDALCERIVLIVGGLKRFDGPKGEFTRLLGREKYMTVTFTSPVSSTDSWFDPFSPTWSDSRTEVELRVPEATLREAVAHLATHYPVLDLATEKLPIERVMHSVLSNPALLGAS